MPYNTATIELTGGGPAKIGLAPAHWAVLSAVLLLAGTMTSFAGKRKTWRWAARCARQG